MNETRQRERTAHVRAADALYLGALLVGIALFFGPAWSQPDGMWYAPGAAYSDLTLTHWPNWLLVRESVRSAGQVPLWRPSILGGAPHAGNPLAALFYPPNWLALILPLTASFHAQYALHALGAGVALYGLARWGYGRSPFASFVGGLGYALSPKWVAHVGAGHVGLCQAYAWLPAIAWSLRACLPRQETGQETGFFGKNPVSLGTLACAVTLALAYLADPRVAFYGAGMAALYAAYRLIGAWRRSGRRAAFALALSLLPIPALFVLLAAVQLLPTAALMPLTTRSAITLQEAGQESLPWRYLLGFLIADRGGSHEWMTYLGLLPLGLGGLALGRPSSAWRGRDRERWFWAGLALLALLYALGVNGPLFPLLYRLLPALGWVRVPARALILVALSTNLLAAWGADALLAGDWSPHGRRWAGRLALFGLLTCGGLGIGLAVLYGRTAPAALYALTGIGGAACAVGLLGLRPHVPRTRWPRVGMQAALLILLLVDLWPVDRSLVELRPAAEVLGEGMDVAAYLAARAPSGAAGYGGLASVVRVYSPSYSVPQHAAARLGLEQLDGVDPVQLSWAASYISLAGGYPLPGYSVTQPPFPPGTDVRSAWQEARPNAALLGAFNVCAVAAAFPIQSPGLDLEARIGDTYVYGNALCVPRAYLLARVEPVGGWQEAQAVLRAGFDPAQGALVEGDQALEGTPGTRPATVRERTPNRVVVEAEAQEPSLLVLAEVWSPGWRVTVDGVGQPDHRVNGVARGVYLEPGAHVVVWSYRPASLRWGAALTMSALLLLAAGLASARIRRCPRGGNE